MKIKESGQDKLFNIIVFSSFIITTFVVLYPLYFILIASISEPVDVNAGNVIFRPIGITFEGYERIFNNDEIWIGYRNTIYYAVAGTLLNVTLTMLAAYPLSRKDFSLKKYIMIFFVITMYFKGGLIPTFLVVRKIGLYGTWFTLIILEAVSVFNLILARTFIQTTIPEELYESAVIDGIDHFGFFTKMVLPLSKPILAVLALYYGVYHWNDFWHALIYLSDRDMMPLQLILRKILIQNQLSALQDDTVDIEALMKSQRAAELMRYGVIIVSSIPVLAVYPFLQKYFVQGVMIGAVKG